MGKAAESDVEMVRIEDKLFPHSEANLGIPEVTSYLYSILFTKNTRSRNVLLVAILLADLLDAAGVEVVAIPVVQRSLLRVALPHNVVFNAGVKFVVGLTFQHVGIFNDLRADNVVEKIYQRDLLGIGMDLHKLFKLERSNIIDLETIVLR